MLKKDEKPNPILHGHLSGMSMKGMKKKPIVKPLDKVLKTLKVKKK